MKSLKGVFLLLLSSAGKSSGALRALVLFSAVTPTWAGIVGVNVTLTNGSDAPVVFQNVGTDALVAVPARSTTIAVFEGDYSPEEGSTVLEVVAIDPSTGETLHTYPVFLTALVASGSARFVYVYSPDLGSYRTRVTEPVPKSYAMDLAFLVLVAGFLFGWYVTSPLEVV